MYIQRIVCYTKTARERHADMWAQVPPSEAAALHAGPGHQAIRSDFKRDWRQFFTSDMADPVESVTVEEGTEDKDRLDDDQKVEETKDNDAMEEHSESGSEASSSSGATTPSGPHGVVLKALRKLLRNYHFSLNQICCSSQEDLTLDDLQDKVEIFKTLQTSFLPSLKQQVGALLDSLDLSESAINPCPNPESVAKILSELSATLHDTRSAVEELALEPPLQAASHDRHLKFLKRHRTSPLLWKTKAVIQDDVCEIFQAIEGLLINLEHHQNPKPGESSQSEFHGSDIIDYLFNPVKCKQRINTTWAKIRIVIDGIIEWSNLSDFAVLQREWRSSTRKCNRMLEALGEIVNGTYWRKDGNRMSAEAASDPKKVEAHKARAIQLAKTGIPIVKLGRIFFDKLSRTCLHPLPFTMDTEMSSNELESLVKKLESFYASIDYMSGHLCVIYESDKDISRKINSLRNVSEGVISELEEALLALSFCLIPASQTPTTDRRPASEQHFKTWFLEFKNQFILACTNLIHATDTCFGDQLEQE
ncbi:uncharacterized protein PGTG_18555, partial [Puccinia graminis f. sp. tritici CRL 75-36-700-3]